MYKQIYKIIVPASFKKIKLYFNCNEISIIESDQDGFIYNKQVSNIDDLISFITVSYAKLATDFNIKKCDQRIVIPIKYYKDNSKMDIAIFLPENIKTLKDAIFVGNIKNSFCKDCNKETYEKLFSK